MIRKIEPFSQGTLPAKVQKAPSGDDRSFADTLKRFIAEVDGQLKEADSMMRDFAVGKRADLHNVMIQTQKADLSLRLLLKIRNKLVEAYQEIMRMQV